MNRSTFVGDWSEIARVLVLGAAAYVAMVATLRASGKRTLAKLNAFDLVVTVALGSVLASIALSSDVSLAEGVAAIVLLVLAQWSVSWASVRTPIVGRLVRAEPSVVFIDGRFCDAALKQVRLTRSEVLQAIRSNGFGDLDLIAAVVLETDGTLSVVPRERCISASAMPAALAGGNVA
jgi:uncharacterized membrane protein YcaP (DUF421 family)